MVIFYDVEGNISRAEHFVDTPTSPAHMSLEEKQEYYKSIGLKYKTISEEMGGKIFNYKVITDTDNIFLRLEHKDVIE